MFVLFMYCFLYLYALGALAVLIITFLVHKVRFEFCFIFFYKSIKFWLTFKRQFIEKIYLKLVINETI